MELSILNSTKKILGLHPEETAFDLDIITHINSVFATVEQLGVGPSGFFIEDNTTLWTDYDIPTNQLGLLKTYIFMKVRAIFDPPTTSFMIEAMNKQISEFEWRLCSYCDLFQEEVV